MDSIRGYPGVLEVVFYRVYRKTTPGPKTKTYLTNPTAATETFFDAWRDAVNVV
jgi:hypothetical protein